MLHRRTGDNDSGLIRLFGRHKIPGAAKPMLSWAVSLDIPFGGASFLKGCAGVVKQIFRAIAYKSLSHTKLPPK
jgi:hypothetical protein